MNIVLFAACRVGYEIANFFGENNEPLSGLVLDSKDDSGLNRDIIAASKVPQEKIYYSDSLYTEQTLADLINLNADLFILSWWPYIIKEALIKSPKMGCLNFHPSYLPYNRGKHYNFWAIVENAPYGVTLHFVDKGVDTGDIAFQSMIETSWEDTGETLWRNAQSEIVRLFKEKFPEIKRGVLPRIPQDLNTGSFHKADELHRASEIDLEKKYAAGDLLNLLRARTFPPYPAAWFVDKGQKYEVRVEIKKLKTINRDNT